MISEEKFLNSIDIYIGTTYNRIPHYSKTYYAFRKAYPRHWNGKEWSRPDSIKRHKFKQELIQELLQHLAN